MTALPWVLLRPAVLPAERKKLKTQTAVQITGDGDGIKKLTGTYVELNFEKACFRRIRDSGDWCEEFLGFDPERQRWIIWEGSQLKAASQSGGGEAWHSSEWRLEDGRDGTLQVFKRDLKDLSKDARREAKAVFKEPLPLTPFRAQECPTSCKTTECKTWGCKTELDLYAHLCLHHRKSNQYYQMHQRLWNERMAEALREREESTEELLRKFEIFMERHGYEKKTTSLKVKDHVRHLQTVVQLLSKPLSRRLTEDEENFQRIKETREDTVSHGHYSTSLRWFRKWVEIAVIEEILASPEGHTLDTLKDVSPETVPPPPVAPPAKRQRVSAATSSPKEPLPMDMMDMDTYVKVKGKVAEAKDTFWAILQLDAAPVTCPRPRKMAEPVGDSPRKSRKRSTTVEMALPRNEDQEEKSKLSKWYAKIAEGSLADAQEIAFKVEKMLESKGNGHVLKGFDLKLDISLDILDCVWLWSYAGTSDHSEVVKSLCQNCLQRMDATEALNYLVKRLLVVARSPHRAPTDLLHSVQLICASGSARVNFTPLEKLAKKRFAVRLHQLRKPDTEMSVKLVYLGCFLAQSMSNWSCSHDAVALWWASFSKDQSSLHEWFHRFCFASGFLWNFCPHKAGTMMQAFINCVWLTPAQRTDVLNLQKWAAIPAPVEAPAPVEVPAPVEALGSLEDPETSKQDAAGQVGCGDIKKSDAVTSSLTAEQRATIEQNRAKAMERKRLRQQSSNPEVPSSLESAEVRPVATPMGDRKAAVEQTVEELDKRGGEIPIIGQIQFRSDHKTGGGFHVRVSDRTGAMDVKFFAEAAGSFRNHPALVKGAKVRLSGFKRCELIGKALEYAPPGRQHELRCDQVGRAKVELVESAAEKVPALALKDALRKPDRSVVTIARAEVSKVEDLEEKQLWNGASHTLRIVWLAGPDGILVRWTLWNDVAHQYGHKQLTGNAVKIQGAQVKVFRGQKELTGCWREGGIQILGSIGSAV